MTSLVLHRWHPATLHAQTLWRLLLQSAAWLRRATVWLLQALCGLRGHERIVRFEPRRMLLECVACGHRSSGWQLDSQGRSVPRPVVRRLRRARQLTPLTQQRFARAKSN